MAGALAVLVGAYGGHVAPRSGEVAVARALGLAVVFGRGGRAAAMGTAVIYVGVAIMILSWLQAGVMARAGLVSARDVAVLAAWWAAPMLVAPPLFSHDLHSCLAQAILLMHHLNPYQRTPLALGAHDPIARAVGSVWRHTRSPYGPLYVRASTVVVTITRPLGMLGMLCALRALSAVGLLLAAWALPRLARAHSVPEAWAMWLGVLNPFVLIHVVGGGHNDGLMLGVLLVAFVLASGGRPVAAIACCALAGMVKAPALVAGAYLTFDWAFAAPTPRLRCRRVLAGTLAGLSTVVAVTWASGLGLGWIAALANPARVRTLLSPATLLSGATTDLAHLAGIGLPYRLVLRWVRRIGVLVALGSAVAIGTRRDGNAVTRTAITFLVVVLCAPAVQPWYLLWVVALAAAGGPMWFGELLVWPSVFLPFAVLPSGRAAPDVVVLSLLAITAFAVAREVDRLRTPVSQA